MPAGSGSRASRVSARAAGMPPGWPPRSLSGHPRRLDNGQPETRYLFVPVAEAELLDTWHVQGLRGTGTHHFAVHDVFVPEERSVLARTAPSLRPDRSIRSRGGWCSPRVTLPCPWAWPTPAVRYELAGAKTPRFASGLLREQPMVQVDVGHAEANLRSGRAFLTETVRDVWDTVSTTGTLSMDQRAALRIATTHYSAGDPGG